MTLRRINNDTLIDGEKLDNLPNNTNQELVNLSSNITSLQNSKVDKTTTINSKPLNDNINLNKADIGLSNVDNTSDIDKPVSTATQLALNTKADKSNTYTKSEVDILIGDVEVDLSNYYNKTETDTLLDDKVDKVSGKGLSTEDYTTIEKNKLDGIEAGAEVNTLNDVIAGTNITIDKTDPLNPIISSTGGGGGSGDVTGPASSTNNGVVLFDGTTGKIIKDSAKTIVTTLGGDDTTIPTSKAVADAIGSAGGGDMLKSVYDTNDDGIVNQADIITNQGDLATLDSVNTAQITNGAVENTKLANMNANTVKGRLSGSGTPQDVAMADLPISTATQTALNGKQNILSEGAFVNGDKTKLDGIQAGAEVNVNADWNSVSGDSQILNKPTIPTNSDYVDLTTTQTIAGIKTFSSSPIVPTPTTDMQVSTKKYVDDNVGGTKITTYIPTPVKPHTNDASFIAPISTTYTSGSISLINIPQAIDVNKFFVRSNAWFVTGDVKIALYTEDGQTKLIDETINVTTANTNFTITLGATLELTAGNYYLLMHGATDGMNLTMSGYISGANTGFDAIAGISGEKVLMGSVVITAGATPATINPVSDITSSTTRQGLIKFVT